MAWTTPRTWATSEVVTASHLNTHVRDNLNFVYSPPACSAYRNTFSIADNSDTTVSLSSGENFDTDSMHSTSTNPSRITINTAGKYLVVARAAFDSNSTGRRSVSTKVNGTGNGESDQRPAVSGASTYARTVFAASFNAGDYIEAVVYQNSGGALNGTCAVDVMWVAG